MRSISRGTSPGNHGVAGGRAEGVQRRVHEAPDVDVPDLDHARDRQEREGRVHDAVAGLHQNHEPAAVDAVGQDPADRREYEDGNRAHQSGEPQVEGGTRQLVDEPQLQGSLDVEAEGCGQDRQTDQAEATVDQCAAGWLQSRDPPFACFVSAVSVAGAALPPPRRARGWLCGRTAVFGFHQRTVALVHLLPVGRALLGAVDLVVREVQERYPGGSHLAVIPSTPRAA